MTVRGQARGDVSCCEAKAELDRVCSDYRFRGSNRSRSILRYLAERCLEGHTDGVKAYAIAIDVLGRPENFDPSVDPIVRIEMSRLRSALLHYYDAFGDETCVSIALPKGGHYVAEFTRTGQTLAANDSSLLEMPREGRAPDTKWSEEPIEQLTFFVRRQRQVAGVAAVMVALVCAAVVGGFVSEPVMTVKPTVVVTMASPDPRVWGEATQTRDMLLVALTRFQTLDVSIVQPTPSLSEALRPGLGNTYKIDLKFYVDGGNHSVWWQIINARTRSLVSSGLEAIDSSGATTVTSRVGLVSLLSRKLASPRGIISALEVTESPEDASGNACVLKAENDLNDARLNDLPAAVACLDRTLATNPANADAIAALSRVEMAQAGGHPSRDVTHHALGLARRAEELAPLSDRAQMALMTVQFYSGRTDSAIIAGRKALTLNPDNVDAAAKLGLILFVSGYWDAGVALARDAGRSVGMIPRDASLVLALDAYRRKDWSSASLLSEQIIQGGLTAAMLRAASLGELKSPQAADSLADLRSISPDFEARFDDIMSARRYDEMLAVAIASGLRKAGANL
ncbi:hypothetical protein [Rhizobium sp. Leaf453]|uniref:tetratricopeptide repeat protein n=1 Tax=Rhizobium sp. Leaf453 TaxID=1736380 RepID=UPI000713D91A|nr:hypothetical protein [Rhizobium sp. Leaf453]KQU07993.1 hypothetical protein ASG68_23300 [Rhizobium sp. Leaf453]